MQSQDPLGNIKQLTEVDLAKPEELVKKIQAAEALGATSHVIGHLPKANTIVTLNGLSYRVEFADFVKGKFKVKLALRDKAPQQK